MAEKRKRQPQATNVDKMPPADVEAEQATLGGCLIDREAIWRVATIVQPDDFYREAHRLIFTAMRDLARQGRPADFLLLTGYLEDRELLEQVGGASYLTGLVSVVPAAAHVEHYAARVAGTSQRRRLIAAAGRIAALAYDPEVEVPESKALAELLKVSNYQDTALVTSNQAWLEYLRVMDARRESGGMIGLPTGFIDLDNLLGGLRPGAFIVVGGRPGMGKTTLGECIADHVAGQGKRVLFASLEMPAQQLLDRRVCRWTGISLWDLERGYKRDDVAAAIAQRAGEQVDYLDAAGLVTDRLLSVAYRARAMNTLDLVIVDYLQLLDDQVGDRGNDTARITYISRRLKNIARDLDVPLLAMSQLSRAVEARQEKRPTLADLRQSGAIEQDADAVLLLHREAYYNPRCGHNVTDVNLAKNRNGRTGEFQLLFMPERFKFVNLERKQRDEPSETA
jgi:replicative DNA helicase